MLTTEANSKEEELTVDYLFATYKHNEQMVDSLSLTQIHNLELAMPVFNTLASLNKSDFNLFMSNLKKKNQDTDVLLILITAVTDTLTCMVKSYTFYEAYSQGNKQTFYLLFKLLEIVKDIVVLEGIEHRRLTVVIKMLQKCSTRIEFEQDVYYKMLNIITQLKKLGEIESAKQKIDFDLQNTKKNNVNIITQLKKLGEIESTKQNIDNHPQNTKNNNVNISRLKKLGEIQSTKQNIDTGPQITKNNNNNNNVKGTTIKMEEDYKLPLKKTPVNAFEVLMKSSMIKKNKK